MDLMSVAQLLGNIGEFFGAVAVVGTLVYLAVQVKHSGRLIQNQLDQSDYSLWANALQLTAASPQVSALYVKGQESMSDLNPAERLQFETLLSTLINTLEHAFRHSTNPENDPDAESWLGLASYWLDHPGGREYWKNNRDKLFYADFADWVDQNLPTLSLAE